MKKITINIAERSHTISTKGTFPIESLSLLDGGAVWLERSMIGHPVFKHLELLLLPEKGLQICRYSRHLGMDWFDWYIDIVEAEWVDSDRLVALDLYADVLLGTGSSYQVLDLDELTAAHRGGKISTGQLEYAIDTLGNLCQELNEGNYVLAWLEPMLLLGRGSTRDTSIGRSI